MRPSGSFSDVSPLFVLIQFMREGIQIQSHSLYIIMFYQDSNCCRNIYINKYGTRTRVAKLMCDQLGGDCSKENDHSKDGYRPRNGDHLRDGDCHRFGNSPRVSDCLTTFKLFSITCYLLFCYLLLAFCYFISVDFYLLHAL